MSTYHSIACDQCRVEARFVSRTNGGFSWMADAPAELPRFMLDHEHHLDRLRVISEHDPRHEAYASFHEMERQRAAAEQALLAKLPPPKI